MHIPVMKVALATSVGTEMKMVFHLFVDWKRIFQMSPREISQGKKVAAFKIIL